MDLIAEISLGISIVTFFVIGMIKFYHFAYNQGYSHGHHSGFSAGMFRAHEKFNKNKQKVYQL